MKQLKGKTILITGGGSGIGKLMAKMFLEKGARMILWDINPDNLNTTVSEFSELGEIYGYRVDVSDREQVKISADKVLKNQGGVDILINNAGIVVGKYFHEHTVEDIDRTIKINITALMYVTKEFLPQMLEINSGHICNIASSAGLISNPKMSVYASSKWAVIGWSDSLRLEMRQLKKDIKVTTVTPYYINTGMFQGVRSVVPILKPEKVARKIVKAIENDRIFLSMPWSIRFVRLSQGLLPVWFFDWFVGGKMGIYKTMEHFEGRKK